MRQRVRGYLDGYYVGRAHSDALHGPAGATRYRIELYRATLDRIEVLASPAEAEDGDVPATGLHQPRVPRVRIYSPQGRGRVFEGPLFDVHMAEPAYEGKAQQGGAIYGRLSGWATAAFDLPEPTSDEPEPVTELELAQVSEPAAAQTADPAESAHAGEDGARAPAQDTVADASPEGASPALPPADEEVATGLSQPMTDAEPAARSTSVLLVGSILVALLLGASTTGAYAAIWLTLALPTLLFRRLFHGILEDAAGLRGLAAALVLGQLACTASAWLGFQAGSCAPLATWALAVGLGAVFLAGLLPWRLPVAINGLAFALMLWPAGQPPSAACVAARKAETRSIHEPATPRTNPDGSWPRRPSLPAAE